jgi:hypothetical protein
MEQISTRTYRKYGIVKEGHFQMAEEVRIGGK